MAVEFFPDPIHLALLADNQEFLLAHRGIAGKIVTPHPFALRYRRANGMHDSHYSAMSLFI